MIIINPYKNGSKSVTALKKEMGGVELKLENSRFVGNPRKKVINWGASRVSEQVAKCQLLNHPDFVRVAGDKLLTFRAMEQAGVVIPSFTTDIAVARKWIEEGCEVVERNVLRGHSGQGIRLVKTAAELTKDCPLFVKYIPKKQEYRVHVFQGKVIDIQRKARKKEVADENVNWKIRNLDGGFIYARDFDENDLPKDVVGNAIAATAALSLDFGAVDIIHNDKQKKSFVLEVNTAPGLQGQTLEAYVRAFKAAGFDNPV